MNTIELTNKVKSLSEKVFNIALSIIMLLVIIIVILFVTAFENSHMTNKINELETEIHSIQTQNAPIYK